MADCDAGDLIRVMTDGEQTGNKFISRRGNVAGRSIQGHHSRVCDHRFGTSPFATAPQIAKFRTGPLTRFQFRLIEAAGHNARRNRVGKTDVGQNRKTSSSGKRASNGHSLTVNNRTMGIKRLQRQGDYRRFFGSDILTTRGKTERLHRNTVHPQSGFSPVALQFSPRFREI